LSVLEQETEVMVRGKLLWSFPTQEEPEKKGTILRSGLNNVELHRRKVKIDLLPGMKVPHEMSRDTLHTEN
jgi:hypothetical protein